MCTLCLLCVIQKNICKCKTRICFRRQFILNTRTDSYLQKIVLNIIVSSDWKALISVRSSLPLFKQVINGKGTTITKRKELHAERKGRNVFNKIRVTTLKKKFIIKSIRTINNAIHCE